MSDIELGSIDEVTGLPALPNGFYWRVKWISVDDLMVRNAFTLAKLEPGMDVSIVQDMKVTKTSRYTYLMFFTKTESYEQTESFTRASSGVMYLDLGDENKSLKKLTDFVKLHEVTSLGIRNAALRVFERWHAEREAKALEGDYPPMKLQVSDD